MLKSISLAILISSLMVSCLKKSEKSPLIFEIKSQSEALKETEDKTQTDQQEQEFSFEKSEATFQNVSKHILESKCVFCHSSEFAELGVNLEEYEKVFDMSDFFTPIVVKEDFEASGLYQEVESGRMPPGEALSPEEVAFIKKWIEEGAIE